jgi:hypothetical protein
MAGIPVSYQITRTGIPASFFFQMRRIEVAGSPLRLQGFLTR